VAQKFAARTQQRNAWFQTYLPGIIHSNPLSPCLFDKRLSTSLLSSCEKIVFVGNRRGRFIWLWRSFSRHDHQSTTTASTKPSTAPTAVDEQRPRRITPRGLRAAPRRSEYCDVGASAQGNAITGRGKLTLTPTCATGFPVLYVQPCRLSFFKVCTSGCFC